MSKAFSFDEWVKRTEVKTMAQIKAKESRLNKLSEESVHELYRLWSLDNMVNWMDSDIEGTVDEFIEWATTAPCDLPINLGKV